MIEFDFSGYQWQKSNSHGESRGPGPNIFSPDNAYLDAEGALHLHIAKEHGKWTSAEVSIDQPLGYGDYSFFISGDPTEFDPNVVTGLFLYKDDTHELDIEFAKWGHPDSNPIQYVIQPSKPQNMHTFKPNSMPNSSTHRILWSPDEVGFESLEGHTLKADEKNTIEKWDFKKLPFQPTSERVMINLWLAGGRPPIDEKEVELVIAKFSHDYMKSKTTELPRQVSHFSLKRLLGR